MVMINEMPLAPALTASMITSADHHHATLRGKRAATAVIIILLLLIIATPTTIILLNIATIMTIVTITLSIIQNTPAEEASTITIGTLITTIIRGDQVRGVIAMAVEKGTIATDPKIGIMITIIIIRSMEKIDPENQNLVKEMRIMMLEAGK